MVQLRLGVDPHTEVPEVWATLRVEDRAAVIERLSAAMAQAVVAASGQGGDRDGEGIEEDEDAGRGVEQIA